MLDFLASPEGKVVVGLIPIAAVFSTAVTVVLGRAVKKRARIDRTIELHELFLSPDYYAKVRAPAHHVALQWNHLPDETRDAYRDAGCVRMGFSGP